MKIGVALTLVLSLACIVGTVTYVVIDMRGSRWRIAQNQHFAAEKMKAAVNARERAKELARKAVAKSGKSATIEQKKKARAVLREKQKKLKGPARFMLDARRVRHRRPSASSGKPTEMPEGTFTAEEAEILDVADIAVSEEEMATAQDVASEALKAKDPRVRLRAVEMLSRFGEAGLPELADFLKDPHEEVANLAADNFDLGVQEIEDPAEQVAIAKLGMLSLDDEDKLRSMAATLTMSTDSREVILALSDVIRDGSAAQAAAAKEAYQNETGEEWKDKKTAEKWLKENYTPPEPEEPAEDVNNDQEGENT